MNESYPANFKRVVLMVSPDGEAFVEGGDREPGEGDMPYIGWERLRKKTQRDLARKDERIMMLEQALTSVNAEMGSLRPMFPCSDCGAIVRMATKGRCAHCATFS